MNIESVKPSSPPLPRAPTQDASATAQQATAKNTKPAEAAKATEVSKSEKNAQQDQNQQKPDELRLEDAVKRLADFVAPTQSQISFSIDDASGLRVVKILDTESKEVIRQFPSEEAIALAQALDKIQGLLIKEKV